LKHTVTCFEKHVSEVVFSQQPIRKFFGNRLVEAHVHGIAQATETEQVFPLRSFRSCFSSGVQESHRVTTRISSRGIKSFSVRCEDSSSWSVQVECKFSEKASSICGSGRVQYSSGVLAQGEFQIHAY
jgi:hypothetical protein